MGEIRPKKKSAGRRSIMRGPYSAPQSGWLLGGGCGRVGGGLGGGAGRGWSGRIRASISPLLLRRWWSAADHLRLHHLSLQPGGQRNRKRDKSKEHHYLTSPRSRRRPRTWGWRGTWRSTRPGCGARTGQCCSSRHPCPMSSLSKSELQPHRCLEAVVVWRRPGAWAAARPTAPRP